MKILKSIDMLLVEDEPDVQENYKEVFEYFFNKVYVASNGEEALNIFKKHNIQAVFTDYLMPKLDGYALSIELKKIDSNLPITVISNSDDRDKLQKCIPLGLAGYLFKPLTYEDIKEYIKHFAMEFNKNKNFKYKISKNHTIDFKSNILINENKNYNITKLEAIFLKFLIEHKNKIVEYDLFYEALYEYEPSYNTLINLVYRLKKKYNIENIKNIKDFGYMMVISDD